MASGDMVVFPGHAVGISHGRGQDIVASRQVITLYNAGQEYRRRPLSDYSDKSIWLKFKRPLVVEALEDAGLAVRGTDKRPFRWTWSRCSYATFLAHRRLARVLLAGGGEDWAGEFTAIPEAALTLLAEAIDSVPDTDATPTDSKTVRRHKRLTDLGLDLGFATPSHFSHAFGKSFHITPRQFLRGDAPVQLSN